MPRILCAACVFLLASLPGLADADELTAIIQKDLTTLGYETGGTDGEMTVQTAVAVSKFQAENGLAVTGEITPQLAGVIKAAISKQGQAAAAAPAAAAPAAAGMPGAQMTPEQTAQLQAQMAAMMQMQGAAMDPAALQAMTQAQNAQPTQAAPAAPAQSPQQACLQQKIAAAQQAQQEQQESAQRRRGFGSLMRGLSRLGGDGVASSIASVSSDIYETTAGIADLESAAKDLGIADSDVESCRNAQ